MTPRAPPSPAATVHRYTREWTLGLVDADGEVVRLRPETIANVVSHAPGLELVVLNGCKSAALCGEVAQRGVLAVGWETKARRAQLDEAHRDAAPRADTTTPLAPRCMTRLP